MATFRDLKAYIDRDGGWEEIPNLVRGRRRVGDHWRYRKTLPDGTVLRTKVSHSLDDAIGPDLLGDIVRRQLRTTMQKFRDVVAGRHLAPPTQVPPEVESIPAWLVTRLIYTCHIPEYEVREMTAEEAQTVWDRYRQGELP